MRVTVDLDNAKAEDVRVTLEIAKQLGLQLVSIRRSYSKKGFHLVFYIHKEQLKHIDFDSVSKSVRHIVKERLRQIKQLLAKLELSEIDRKLAMLRAVLGDDANRILFDLLKKDVMPTQVFFYAYFGKRIKEVFETD